MGEDHCRTLLYRAARDNHLILLESLMGLHDNQPSNAELARMFNIPVVLVLNVAKFAQTANAMVEGMAKYGVQPQISAVIGNRVGSDNHHRIMSAALNDIYAGSMRRDDRLALPERHLGLVQASEITDLDDQLQTAAELLDKFEIRVPFEDVSFSACQEKDPPIPPRAGGYLQAESCK